jgi:aminobenzoyl-glutamate utilization protein B
MQKTFQPFGVIMILSFVLFHANAQKKNNNMASLKSQASDDLQSQYDIYKKKALQIWSFAELGYKEYKSSALLQQTLKDNEFTVEVGVAGIPTAFVATYGSGRPLIGILAEFDALPGLSQDSTSEKSPIAGMKSGH